jgi:hypothetical protein
MTTRLTLNGEKPRWYAESIASLESHLGNLRAGEKYFGGDKYYAERKNLAYSLQYLEFINRVLKDISLSEVLWTQNVKSFVVHGAAVIEAIFNYLVISGGYGNTTQWKQVSSHYSSEFEIEDKKYRNAIEVLEKLETPVPTQMTFDQLAKKVERKKLLGQHFNSYSKIKPIRQLRNKIHIHAPADAGDTDWNTFNNSELILIRSVLYSVLTSEVFTNGDTFKLFNYLNENES